jgi:arginine/lysine/ornithine decarboxylase
VNSLEQKLASYMKSNMYSFHTPGHKGRRDILAPLVFPDYDLTELPDLDMLHNPRGVIAQAQGKAAKAYGAEETFFLVNGATVGNQAMFLALRPNLRDKKIRIERKAHRSVIGALVLSGLTPEYIPAIIHPDFNLPLGLDSEKYVDNCEQVGAFHLTNPSYYGTVIDLDSIIKRRNKEFPTVPILVDQAHGSHFRDNLFPRGAVEQGADLVLHSTHKTLAALTQAGMLHVQGKRVDRLSLRSSLELLQTSSPSYLLMASLENAINHLENKHLWEDLYGEVLSLQEKLDGPLRLLTAKDAGKYGIKEVDWSKILVNVSSLGIRAEEAVHVLRSSFLIEPELWDDNNILFMLGIGSRPEEVRILCKALENLVKSCLPKPNTRHIGRNKEKTELLLPPLRITPREAWLAPKRIVKVQDSLGEIAGETISIYPPGIPLVASGEEITSEVLDCLLRAKEYNWQGWQGFGRGEILVVDG